MHKPFALYRQLYPLLLLIFLDSFGFFLVIPMIFKIFYHSDFLNPDITLVARNKLVGLTLSLPVIAAFLTAPVFGVLSDKIGRRKTLLCGVIFLCVGFFLPIIGLVKKSLSLFLIGRVLSGLGSGSQPVAQAVVSDVCSAREKPLFFGSIALIKTVALLLGPLLGGLLSDNHLVSVFNNETPFVFSIALSLCNVVLLYFFFKETHAPKKDKTFSGILRDMVGLPALIHGARLTGLVVLFFCLELSWSLYYQSIALFLHLHFAFSAEKISLFTSMIGVSMIMGLIFINPVLLKYLQLKTILIGGMVLLGVSLLLSPLLLSGWMPWVMASCVAIFTGVTYVSLVALISNQIGSSQQGVLMGYLGAFMYLAWFSTAIGSGFLISLFQSLPMFISALIIALGAALIWLLKHYPAKNDANSCL